jgi:hypothetical protein
VLLHYRDVQYIAVWKGVEEVTTEVMILTLSFICKKEKSRVLNAPVSQDFGALNA